MTNTLPTGAEASIRESGRPNHHLWNNNGTWWCHHTVHQPDHTKRRVRRSLRTNSVGVARRLRDNLPGGLGRRPTV